MKTYISNSLDIYTLVTFESSTHYICNDILYSKEDVILDYYPLDILEGILHLHVISFY